MNYSWITSDWTQALGWTFVHSIWQIALIGLALFIALRFVPRRNANTRYAISTIALWLIVCTSLSTFLIMLPSGGDMLYGANDVLYMGGAATMSFTESVAAWLEVRIPMMITIWAGGVAILMIRLLISLGWVRHVRSSSLPEKEIQQTLNSIISRLKLKIKPLAASTSHVSSPMTIGHLKPIVLFPIGILNQISPKEVEAILTHELAHIVRKDYLSNLVQSVIETLFYYHPITWWISAVVRSERENRADDLAVKWCGDQLGYAKALMAVQEMQVSQGPSLAIGFASRKGAMLARIKRILNVPYKNHNQMEKTVLLSLTTLCFLAFTLTSHTTTELPESDELTYVADLILVEEIKDSIPSQGTYRIHKKTDAQEINVEVEDGEIKELKVNGEEVAPEDYDTYDITINELFGNMQAPRSVNDFEFEMPPMPEAPEGMHEMEIDIVMPAMPDMPPMPFMEYEYIVDGDRVIIKGGKDTDIEVFTKGFEGENGEIKIFLDGDTIIQAIDLNNWQDVQEDFLEEYKYEWKENAEQWKEMGKQYKDAMKLYKEEYKDNEDIIRYEIRSRNEEIEDAQNQLRFEIRGHQEDIENEQRILKEMYELKSSSPTVMSIRSHRISLSEEMVNDGLVEPGTEIDVQLTPNRLKINGKKMSDEVHQKYLELYEKQQGVELSGKSRVEFTTKSKQRL